MNAQLEMFPPPHSTASPNAISSPAPALGQSHLEPPPGQTIDKFSREVAPANRFLALDAEWERLIAATSGPISETSSRTAALQSSLANRLRQRMAAFGSPEYVLTAKEWPMQSGPPIFALRASGHHISVKGCTGWPTPTCGDDEWAGPRAMARLGTSQMKTYYQRLRDATTSARDWRDGRASQETMDRNARPPNEQAVMLAGWTTPRQSDPKTGHEYSENMTGKSLPMDASLVSGLTPSGTPASTANSAALALNPNFPCWLMGFPEIVSSCAPGSNSWALIQSLLTGSSPSPESIASAVSEAMGTP